MPFAEIVDPLAINTRVLCRDMMGVVRYIGPSALGDGLWMGIEVSSQVASQSPPGSRHHQPLTFPSLHKLGEPGAGEHDGRVGGKRYFRCKDKQGIMVRPREATWHGKNCAKVLREYQQYGMY